ncbi:DNA-binding response regulator [Marinicella litoralis]|uniref:LuxR family two component transcriptional regulator n=1 Tax=Marinicella litoralis TaxID=644220 RepID=A0A4R6XMJ2_9GAMM|nr:DNA-binding response regulator [Marinicella litoralis]TDR19310.1 LuxR family two component transcriptional regulator [Marinicella litoralis]
MTKNKPTILAVDDNPDSLNILNLTLSAQGFTVLVANSGVQALNILHKVQPDLILLDAIMPEMDGFETCQAIKHINPDAPIIFMTGLSDTEHVVQGLSRGAVDYLIKPLNHEELIARVKVHINTAQQTRISKQALESAGQHLATITSDGQVIWTTAQANTYIKALNKQDLLTLIAWLKQAETTDLLELLHEDSTLNLTYLTLQKDGSHLIKFKASDLKLEKQTLKLKLKITRRESDVLYWVAKGKTDWEISKILTISERTVNKHLEQIYRKLEVNNRTAASAMALNALN